MVMEGHFHQQVCPNINKNTTNDKTHVDNFQGRHFAEQKKLTLRERSTTSHRVCKVDRIHTISDYWTLFPD
jgi:hypothetical protein